MKLIKNRYVLSAICLVVAGFLAFYMIPRIYKSQEATAMVVRLTVSVSKGDMIDASMVKLIETGAFHLQDGVYSDTREVIGSYVLMDLPAEVNVTKVMLTDKPPSTALDEIMESGKQLITISLPSAAAGLASHLQQGDIVTVSCYVPEKEHWSDSGTSYLPATVKTDLRSLTVYSVENAQTVSTNKAREQRDTSSDGSADTIPRLLTLVVTPDEAIILVEAEYTGKFHVIFERRGEINP